MKKGWRVVISIVMIAVLLGAVCVGVGMLTGADISRIYSVLDKRFMITQYYEWFLNVLEVYKTVL